MNDAGLSAGGTPHRAADAVLNALPLPVITIAADGKVADANVAAESFFESSVVLLRRQQLRDSSNSSPVIAALSRWFCDD